MQKLDVGEGATPLHVTVEQPRMEVMGMNILPLSATLVGMMSDAKRINKMAKVCCTLVCVVFQIMTFTCERSVSFFCFGELGTTNVVEDLGYCRT